MEWISQQAFGLQQTDADDDDDDDDVCNGVTYQYFNEIIFFEWNNVCLSTASKMRYHFFQKYHIFSLWVISALFGCAVSASADHYSCLSALKCTEKNMSDSAVRALGKADANSYLCSKDLRPGED